MIRLTDKYANAYADLWGSRTPCVYKTGPAWHTSEAQAFLRVPRPIYSHPIGGSWLSIGRDIIGELDSAKVEWNAINPLAYADAGQANPFCPFVITICVTPLSLTYDAAVAAGKLIHDILNNAGFPDIQVAFIESVVHRSAAGPKLLSFDPLFDPVPELRKDFTSTLGLPIAPLKAPQYEGTAALYYRLSQDDGRVAMLTCAHVARPPPLYGNTGMTLKKGTGQAREDIIALGTGAYHNAVTAIKKQIRGQYASIEVWRDTLQRLGEEVEGEVPVKSVRRKEFAGRIERAEEAIEGAYALHDEVTERRTTPEQRIIGHVLHSEATVEPNMFTKDWALIELNHEMIDWKSFKGNKIYIGMSYSSSSLS